MRREGETCGGRVGDTAGLSRGAKVDAGRLQESRGGHRCGEQWTEDVVRDWASATVSCLCPPSGDRDLAIGIQGKGAGRRYPLGSGQDQDGVHQVLLDETTPEGVSTEKGVRAPGHLNGQRSGRQEMGETESSQPVRQEENQEKDINVSQESSRSFRKGGRNLPRMPGSEQGSGHSCSFPVPRRQQGGTGRNSGGREKGARGLDLGVRGSAEQTDSFASGSNHQQPVITSSWAF